MRRWPSGSVSPLDVASIVRERLVLAEDLGPTVARPGTLTAASIRPQAERRDVHFAFAPRLRPSVIPMSAVAIALAPPPHQPP